MNLVPKAIKAFFKRHWRFSDYFLIIGLAVALAVLFGTDPDAGLIQLSFGADVVSKLSAIPASIFGVAALWISSRALYDYLDKKELAKKAAETPQGAGLVMIAVALTQIALAIIIVSLIGIFR